jgi:nitrate/nitrite transporter NarK
MGITSILEIRDLPRREVDIKMSRARTAIFSATMGAAIGLGTFPAFAFGVLAPFLRDEFGLSRSQLGLLTTALFVIGAPASLVAGKIVDIAAGRKLAFWIFGMVAAATLGFAVAPSYHWLLLVSGLAGIPLALGNPGTNKLVARFIAPENRGVVMGIKQSGVQIAALLTGAALPAAARAWGWRTAIALALIPAALGGIGAFSIPKSRPLRRRDRSMASHEAGRGVRILAIYAFLMGAAMAAMVAYLPLYAEESIGFSVTEAGALAATIGLIGVGSRIFWGWRSDRFAHLSMPLAIMSAGALIATCMIVAAQNLGAWLLWPAAISIGATGAAWMAVGMLAVVAEVDGSEMGRASGVVVFGFFCGQMSSPLLFGYSVDVSGSYVLGWIGVLTTFALATLIASQWHRSRLHDPE